MKTIEIENIGPIKSVSIPCPDDGGLVVLKGGQGSGKSTALRAVSAALGGPKKDLSARDGQARGRVEIGDCKLSITTSRATRRGEFECDSIEGRFDISKLVDPQILDEEKADAARIKALVNLSGVESSVDPYRAAIPGFDDLGVDSDTDDPVALAGRVKRALEKEARKFATIAAQKQGEVDAFKSAEIDIEGEDDEEKLQADFERIRDEFVRKTAEAKAASDNAERAKTAGEKVRKIRSEYSGVSIEAATEAWRKANDVVVDLEADVANLEAELRKMKNELKTAEYKTEQASNNRDAAIQHFETVDQLQAVIESTGDICGPTDEELESLKAKSTAARQAIENGALIRKAKEDANRAKAARNDVKYYRKLTEEFRDLAKSTDDILSAQLPEGVLRIDNGRLVTSTDRSNNELFCQLSEGERYEIAIDLTADQLKQGGVMVIPQAAYEGLTSSTSQRIHDRARRRKVVIVTAHAEDCDLEAVEL